MTGMISQYVTVLDRELHYVEWGERGGDDSLKEGDRGPADGLAERDGGP